MGYAPAAAGRQQERRPAARRYMAEPQPESAVADPLAFHRALRGLYRLVPAVDRWELDETATAERFAADRLGVPVRRARMEPCYEIHLVVDDSPSMTLWLDLVPGLARLLEQARFRDVRVSYLATSVERPEQVVLRATRGGDGTPAAASHVPSGRQIVWIVTDTLAPAWRSDVIAPALRRWSRFGPVALFNLLPERMWRWGGLRTQWVRMVPARGGAAGTPPPLGLHPQLGPRARRPDGTGTGRRPAGPGARARPRLVGSLGRDGERRTRPTDRAARGAGRVRPASATA
ncbi:hypothetical protein [Candidatus Frankia alpina]|uniref:hypothetical protein n=1 Tax=Candidatus Frankia alpina TaxID=2699483 RepID=UPI001A9990DB|nr:hypothetical protein [Candidatus Frankia alpina]